MRSSSMVSVSLIFISCGLDSNRADVLRGDQNIDLFEKPLKMFLISLEKPFSLPIGAGDDFNLDDIFDKIHAAMLPTTLIAITLRADSERAKNTEKPCTNLLNLLPIDI